MIVKGIGGAKTSAPLAIPSKINTIQTPLILAVDTFIPTFKARSIKDIPYKQSLLVALGLKTNDTSLLNSIVGAHEFMGVAKKFDKRINLMHNPNYSNGHHCENIFSHKLRANFHMHTQYSDGCITIPELLEQAKKYADGCSASKNKPFYIAITDHDTVEGCKEALSIIASDPSKYQNLKVVLGCEFSLHRGHTLGLCLNPFDKFFEHKSNLFQKQYETDEKAFRFTDEEFYNYAQRNKIVGVIAHPAMYFRMDDPDRKSVFNQVIKSFSEFKKHLKFSCFEGYYQSYNYKIVSKDGQEYIKNLLKLGKKVKLTSIGCNDSHSNNIFGLLNDQYDELKDILN